MRKKLMTRETARYLLVGVLTSGVNLSVFFVLKLLGLNYLISNAVAWVATVLVSYVANRRFVFRLDALPPLERRAEFKRFANSRLLSGAVDLLLMWALVAAAGWDSSLVKLLNSAVVVALNYVLSLSIFKDSQRRKGSASA